MLEVVKKALRVSNSAFDDEIQGLIDAGKRDLQIAGIKFDDESEDPLIRQAVITYCKGEFGFDNPEADRFHDSYVMLKQHLSLSGDYREPLA